MNRILGITFLLAIAFSQATAQEKPGCNPKACKPGNTKTGEAVAITQLRENMTILQKNWNRKNPQQPLQMDLTPGSGDQQSLDKLWTALLQIRKSVTGESKVATAFQDASGAKKVKWLSGQVAILQEELISQ